MGTWIHDGYLPSNAVIGIVIVIVIRGISRGSGCFRNGFGISDRDSRGWFRIDGLLRGVSSTTLRHRIGYRITVWISSMFAPVIGASKAKSGHRDNKDQFEREADSGHRFFCVLREQERLY